MVNERAYKLPKTGNKFPSRKFHSIDIDESIDESTGSESSMFLPAKFHSEIYKMPAAGKWVVCDSVERHCLSKLHASLRKPETMFLWMKFSLGRYRSYTDESTGCENSMFLAMKFHSDH